MCLETHDPADGGPSFQLGGLTARHLEKTAEPSPPLAKRPTSATKGIMTAAKRTAAKSSPDMRLQSGEPPLVAPAGEMPWALAGGHKLRCCCTGAAESP